MINAAWSNFDRYVTPYEQYLDGNGKPYPYCRLNFYQSGTLVRKNTYSNPDLDISHVNSNPVVANPDGRFVQPIFFEQGDYRVVLTDKNDVPIPDFDADPVSGAQLYGLLASVAQLNSTISNCKAISADYSCIASDWGKTLLVDASGGDRLITLLNPAIAGNGWWCYIMKIDDTQNKVTIQISGSLSCNAPTPLINGETTLIFRDQYEVARVISNAYDYFVEDHTGSSEDIQQTNNLFIDGQFNFPSYSGPLSAGVTPMGEAGWMFEKDGTGGTDDSDFIDFPVGDTSVVQNPLKYFHYEVTVVPSGETKKRFYMPFKWVRTLEGILVTYSFFARSSASNQLTPFYEQNFGSGGSPSPINTVSLDAVSLTPDWSVYIVTFTIDAAAGKTLGTNDDSQLLVGVEYPLNALINIDITNELLQEGSKASQYPYRTYEQVKAMLPDTTEVTEIKWFNRVTVPTGYLDARFGDAVSRTLYFNLYTATSLVKNGDTSSSSNVITNVDTTNLRPAHTIARTGDTTITPSPSAVVTNTDTTGLSNGMIFSCPNFTGLVSILSIDSPTQFTASAAAATAATAAAFTFYVNDDNAMQLTSTNVSGIAYILTIDSSTQIKISKNATASGTTPIRFYLNGAGDGTTTFNVPKLARCTMVGAGGSSTETLYNTVGSKGGEETHTQTAEEVGKHPHTVPTSQQTGSGPNLPNTFATSVAAANGPIATLLNDGGQPFNIMQPSYVGLPCIKY